MIGSRPLTKISYGLTVQTDSFSSYLIQLFLSKSNLCCINCRWENTKLCHLSSHHERSSSTSSRRNNGCDWNFLLCHCEAGTFENYTVKLSIMKQEYCSMTLIQNSFRWSAKTFTYIPPDKLEGANACESATTASNKNVNSFRAIFNTCVVPPMFLSVRESIKIEYQSYWICMELQKYTHHVHRWRGFGYRVIEYSPLPLRVHIRSAGTWSAKYQLFSRDGPRSVS